MLRPDLLPGAEEEVLGAHVTLAGVDQGAGGAGTLAAAGDVAGIEEIAV